MSPFFQTLQDVISCFCATIHSQTQDYATMTRVFRATLGELLFTRLSYRRPRADEPHIQAD